MSYDRCVCTQFYSRSQYIFTTHHFWLRSHLFLPIRSYILLRARKQATKFNIASNYSPQGLTHAFIIFYYTYLIFNPIMSVIVVGVIVSVMASLHLSSKRRNIIIHRHLLIGSYGVVGFHYHPVCRFSYYASVIRSLNQKNRLTLRVCKYLYNSRYYPVPTTCAKA